MNTLKKSTYKMRDLYIAAHTAGMEALKNSEPTPMMVGTPTTLFSNTIDETKTTYVINDGVCGFAWIKIKPARGNFVKWCKQNGIGHTDRFSGGYTIWVHQGNQSMERKIAYATAFARVLANAGINAYMDSRMD